VPSAKIISAFVFFVFLSACASLPGSRSSSDAQMEDITAVETRSAALEVEVSRLKSENARLANQLLELQRERDRLSAVQLKDTPLGEVETAAAATDLPAAPEIIVPDPQANAIVDDAKAPALSQTDVPVETAPRLVQPTFASNEIVFENEEEGEIKTSSILFGVHLASYRKLEQAREGWRKLQRENPDELGLLSPRIEKITIPEKGVFLRLVGGGFSSNEKAQALCGLLKQKNQFCSVVSFEGERLSLAKTGR